MGCAAQVLEVGEGVLYESFVERSKIRRTVAKWILACKMVEIPIDELPIEAIVIRNEEGPSSAVNSDPPGECLHDGLRIVKLERFLAAESAYGASASGIHWSEIGFSVP